MNKNLFKSFILILCLIGSYSYGDIDSTRNTLGEYSACNKSVLEGYDRISTQWNQYHENHQNRWDFEKLLTAVEYAAKKHEGQVRKDAEKTPYIVHPLGVAEILWNEGGIRSVNVLTAAILHDTLEDTDATEIEIESLFGPRVLYTVIEVTNDPSLTGEENKQRQVDHAPTLSLDGQLVKLADRLYNVRDLRNPPPSWSNEKVDQYYGWGEKLLNALTGTNEALETALDQEIQSHRGDAVETKSLIGLHRVKHKRIEFDPYEGYYIDEYHFYLDNNTVWSIGWSIYENNNLNIKSGDVVEIVRISENQYLMVIKTGDSDTVSIDFKEESMLPNHFYAIRSDQ